MAMVCTRPGILASLFWMQAPIFALAMPATDFCVHLCYILVLTICEFAELLNNANVKLH